MSLNLNKYKFICCKDKSGKDTTIALSSYGGHPVKGYAKCDPKDTWEDMKGMELAAARCNVKVCEKRYNRAQKKYAEALAQLEAAQKYIDAMTDYLWDSKNNLREADKTLEEILKDM